MYSYFPSLSNSSVFCLICIIVCSSAYPSFQQFYVKYSRNNSYDVNSTEYLERKSIYEDRIASFANTVSQINDVNNFTDWTEKQLAGLRGLLPLPIDQRVSSSVLAQPKLSVPSSLDWRTQNIVTSIKNQGQCGACWAFTSAAVVQSYLIQKGKQNISIDLSQQFLLQCTTDSSCTGGFIQNGLDKIKKECPKEESYNYIGPNLYSGSICSTSGIQTKISRISKYNFSDSDLINMLQNGPVAVAIDSSTISSYSGGVITCSGKNVDHAVVIIGYTNDYYIFKNSWGTSWGIGGYGYVTRNGASNCGVTLQASYVVQFEYYYTFSIIALFLAYFMI